MAYLSPIGNDPQIDSNGDPLNGGKILTYGAGTSTAAATYTTSAAGTPQANPVILNSRGVPANPIWLTGGQSYKFVITDASGVVLQTIDGITGVNDPASASAADQWVLYASAPTYISATSFSVAGDQTGTLQKGRRLKTTNTGGTIYSTITNSVFGTVTTVTVANDSGTLDSGLSAVSYGLLSATSPSIPTGPTFSAYQSTLQSVANATFTKVVLQTEEWDVGAAFDAATNYRFQPTVAGYYQIEGAVTFASVGGVAALIYKNGVEYKRGSVNPAATVSATNTVQALVSMNGTTDYVELYCYQESGGAANTATGASRTYLQGFLARLA